MSPDFIAGCITGAFVVASLTVSFFAWACCALGKKADIKADPYGEPWS